jgi:apolipoprotein N-acyltransferase
VLCILISDFPQYTWPFASTALVPFFFFLYHEPSLYQVVKYAFLFGGITMAGSIAWFFDAYPLEWAGIENAFVALATIFAVWTLTSLVSAVFSVFFALVFKKACRGSWHDVLMAPSAWILMEYARALFLSLVFLGDQSSIGADWGLNLFGYSLAWSRLGINLAPLGGVFLMSFIGVLLNYAIFFMTRRLWEMKRNVATVSLFLAGSFAAYSSAYVLPMERNVLHDPQVVAVITTNFQALSDSNLLSGSAKAISLERLLREAVSGSPDIIVLPEGSRALDYLGTTTIQALLSQGQKEVLLIDSSQVSDPLGRKSRALFFSSSHGTIGSSDKSFLMPYGEYLPYIATLAGRFAGQGAWVTTFARNRNNTEDNNKFFIHDLCLFQLHTLATSFSHYTYHQAPIL